MLHAFEMFSATKIPFLSYATFLCVRISENINSLKAYKLPVYLEWNSDSRVKSTSKVLFASFELKGAQNMLRIDYKLPLRIRSYDILNEGSVEIGFSEEEWIQRFSRPEVLPVIEKMKEEIETKYNLSVEYIKKKSILLCMF